MFNLKWALLASVFVTGQVFAHLHGVPTTAQNGLIVRFDHTESMKTFLRANEFDITGINYNTNEIEALLSEEELALIVSQKANIKFSFPQNLLAAPDDEYKNPDEIEDFIKDIHARYPDITEIVTIGKTLEGRGINAIKISDNVRTDEQEPVFFVNGMHHAREVMTPEITTDMIEYLVTNYGTNAEVTKWVNDTEIWVIPMFNLDGNAKMWADDSMWRKNTRDGHGVDINRNYPTAWNTCNGSSGSKNAQDYRGVAAGSEPETQAMMNFVGSIKPVFSISYHSYSEIVIYPFGCKPKRTPAEEAIESIGKEIGAALKYKPGTAWELLYSVDGGDIDYMYVEHQVIPYVIEVNSTWEGFHPSYSKHRNKTVERNRPGWQLLLNKLQGPSIQGVVKGGEFTTINISKAGDTKIAQTYKINPDGSYYVILKPGKYDVSFEGSRSQKLVNLDVTSKQVINF